jgi:hypothetical protein
MITVPHTARTAKLHWVHQSFTQAPPGQQVGPGLDRQDLILLTPDLVTIEILYRELRNDATWQPASADLTHYIGQTFFIYFNAFDDGDGLRTWMNLDDVRLELCFPVSPTPTSTPILATQTPIPIITSDAVERTQPLGEDTDGSVRSLAVDTPTAEAPLEIREPGEGEDVAAVLSALGNFIARNWMWVFGFLGIVWLLWRFVLR